MKTPGILQWEKFAAGELSTPDSLEGVLRHPLNITAEYDGDYGTPRRGNLLVAGDAGTVRPLVAAEIVESLTEELAEVTFYADVEEGADVLVYAADATTGVAATVTSVTKAVTNERGLVTGANRIGFAYGNEDTPPADPVLVTFADAEGDPVLGVVYESVTDLNFAMSVEGEFRPTQVAGGETALVQSLSGITLRSELLFVRAV